MILGAYSVSVLIVQDTGVNPVVVGKQSDLNGGIQIAAGGTEHFSVLAGDELYVVAPSGTTAITVLASVG